MKNIILVFLATLFISSTLYACDNCKNYDNKNFKIKKVSVSHNPSISSTIWKIEVAGNAGETSQKLWASSI